MTASAPSSASAATIRLLVIVSSDYGELGAAMYFISGLQLEVMPAMLLPEALAQRSDPLPGVAATTYRSLADIVRLVDEFRPTVVMLFCGYLLSIGRRMTLLKAWWLRGLLHRRHVIVMTSDPFLGLLDKPASLRFDEVLARGAQRQAGPALRLLAWLLAVRLFLMRPPLRRDWHVYCASIDRLALGDKSRRLTYFNGLPPIAVQRDAVAGQWLFVLSQIDYDVQRRRFGTDRFHALLAARISEALQVASHVRLICPEGMKQAIRGLIDERVFVQSAPSYLVFMRHLMEAQYVFFWNYYSFSLVHRVIARRAVFFFDEGHMVAIMPSLRQAGIDTYYAGWTPPLLSIEESLDPSAITREAGEMRARFDRIVDQLSACLSPMQLLARATAKKSQ